MSFHIDSSVPKNIADVIRDGYQKVDALWPISQTVSFITNKGKTRNGYCKKISQNFYTIAINKDIVNSKDILNVVIHELLHSYPTVFSQGHKGEWLKRAAIINKTYNLNVKRTNNYERAEVYPKKKYKYHVWCTCCHHEWNYSKTPKWINSIEKVKCPYCKTHTIQIGSILKEDTFIEKNIFKKEDR